MRTFPFIEPDYPFIYMLPKDRKLSLPRKLLLLFLVFTLFFPFSPAYSPSAKTTRLQPLLLILAAQTPTDAVNVIVQTDPEQTKTIQKRIAELGGYVTRNLSIIHALGVTITAEALPALAQEEGVRWVSWDAPVQESQNSQNAVFTTWATEFGKLSPYRSTLAANFQPIPILADHTLWFNSVVSVQQMSGASAALFVSSAQINFEAEGALYSLPVPNGVVVFSSSATKAQTTFDPKIGMWYTVIPRSNRQQESFLAGVSLPLAAPLPAGITNVTWSARFESSDPQLKVEWKWGAAVYSQFTDTYAEMTVNAQAATQSASSGPAGTPQNFKTYLRPGGTGNGGNNFVGNSTSAENIPLGVVKNGEYLLSSPFGPDQTFGVFGKGADVFSGFEYQITPGYAVTKVEVVVLGYVETRFNKQIGFNLYVGDAPVGTAQTRTTSFDNALGEDQAKTITVELIGTRPWSWGDFAQGISLGIDQSNFTAGQSIRYDAVGLRVTSSPGADPVVNWEATLPTIEEAFIPTSKLQEKNVFNQAIRTTEIWAQNRKLQGNEIGVAIIDSGIAQGREFLAGGERANVNFSKAEHTSTDSYGHGTFVAGIVAGTGKGSNGRYMGVAPKANLLNIRVSDDKGMATEGDVVEAIQWVLEHKEAYNIRVVNLSLNSSVAQPYYASAMNAAVEILWFNGIVVVVSAGNNGTSDLFPPANDPFIITVGASDDKGTPEIQDDTVAPFSAYGIISSTYGITDTRTMIKPDLVAPGTNIISALPQNNRIGMGRDHPNHRMGSGYFRMSGTSMAAPMVTGAVAILLQAYPDLNPDQVKYRLMTTANKNFTGYNTERGGAGYLDIYAAINTSTTESANIGLQASQMLWNGEEPINWGSVNWNSVNWNSVNWNSVNWNSVNWSSDHWDDIRSRSDMPAEDYRDNLFSLDTLVLPTDLFLPHVSNQ